jgi:hypothetical protein
METDNIQMLSTLIYLILIFISVIISVMGSILIIRALTHRQIDVKEEIVRNRNIGMALVLGSFIWTLGRMCLESTKPIMNVWYDSYASGFAVKSILAFLLGMIGSLLAAILIGAITVYLAIKILLVITKDINEWWQMKRGNMAVGIVISITVLVVGTFFESIVSYIVMHIFDISL